jgi:uncharacterized membrane protein YedE/YeeE
MDHPYGLILLISSLCGLAAGFVMHRSSFCVTGMFRDAFLFRDFFMLRVLLVLVVVSMLVFELGLQSGLLSHYPFPLLGPPSLANVIGGVLFGIGMVLAGGCVVGTLYKMGSGSVVSGVAFIGLLLGSVAYASVHPWWAEFSELTSLGTSAITIPQLVNIPSLVLTLPLGTIAAIYLWRLYNQGALNQQQSLPGSIQPLYAALVLVAIGLVSYLFIGMPLGITTSYTKLGANLEAMLGPAHIASVAYYQAMPLDYIPPFSDTHIQGGPGPKFDGVAAIQYPLIVGITLGAMISALLLKELRFHYRVPAIQFASALLGGMIMGFAARMVPGCNIWHLWGGVPILSMQSLLFLIGIIPGAWIGSKLLTRYVVKA